MKTKQINQENKIQRNFEALLKRTMIDEDFRKKCLADPLSAIEDAGIKLKDGVVGVHFINAEKDLPAKIPDDQLYILLPQMQKAGITEAELDSVVGGSVTDFILGEEVRQTTDACEKSPFYEAFKKNPFKYI